MKKWQDITKRKDTTENQRLQWVIHLQQGKAVMDVTNTSMDDVLPLLLRSVLHAEGIEMNLNMLIHHDDFHLSTFSIIQDGKFQPQVKPGIDLGAYVGKALGYVARKAVPRLAPVIGWVVLANDIYNMIVPED